MDGRDLLANYFRTSHASQAEVARVASCSEGHLSLILAKKRWASPHLARRLSSAVGGVVPAAALVSPKVHEAADYLRAG